MHTHLQPPQQLVDEELHMLVGERLRSNHAVQIRPHQLCHQIAEDEETEHGMRMENSLQRMGPLSLPFSLYIVAAFNNCRALSSIIKAHLYNKCTEAHIHYKQDTVCTCTCTCTCMLQTRYM